jgi:hypothetical protein
VHGFGINTYMRYLLFLILLSGCTPPRYDSVDIQGGQSKMPPMGMYCYCVRSGDETTMCKDAKNLVENSRSREYYINGCQRYSK